MLVLGDREIVGFGVNGNPVYVDRSDSPMPAIRWEAPSADTIPLRAKENGDWKSLTIEEKKKRLLFAFSLTFHFQ